VSFREDGYAAVDWVAGYLEQVGDLPVLAQTAPGDLLAALPDAAPEQGEPFAAILRDLDELLLPAVTHWQHPRFFAYFASTATGPGVLAELLAAALNNVAFIWRTSPAATELETACLRWTAQLLGLPPSWHGHIEDSASISTLAALFAARETTGRNVVVASEEAHSSVERAARILAMELRKVPADDEFRLDPSRLDAAGAAAIVATVGSTSTASVDPVPALADAARATGAWLHVDAAYAGSAMVCAEHRWAFEGVDRADSVVVNAHKWMATPMDCSLLWTSRPDDVRAAFSLVRDYLQTGVSELTSLSDYGPALGRRFRALKLWTVLARSGARACRRRSASTSASRRRSRRGSRRSPAGRSPRRSGSRSSASAVRRRTRRTRGSSTRSTPRASPSSRARACTGAPCSASRSAATARRRRTSGAPGTPFAAPRRGTARRTRGCRGTPWLGAFPETKLPDVYHRLRERTL
jgi:aromatic-L-amino-acid decarboxylase